MPLLVEGQHIGDNYEVERLLGQGAFAEVYRVQHRFLGRLAMKVFKTVGTGDQINEMLAEARLLSTIGHRHIVRMYDAGTVSTTTGECGYFTMEYVPGGSLDGFWRGHDSWFVDVGDTVTIIGQAAAGLAVAHAERPPIVHRDITPHNILVGYDRDGLRVRISDFGLAKQVNIVTGLASTRGTLAYKSPESLRNPRADSRAGDIWALGTIAYLLLTDRLPFEGTDNPYGFFGAQHRHPPPSPDQINPTVDEELAAIVLNAIAVDPGDRIPDAIALTDALARRAARHTGDRRPEPTPSRTAKHRTDTDDPPAARQAETALRLAQQAGSLTEAANLLERACNRSVEVRTAHEHRLRLWRKGVIG